MMASSLKYFSLLSHLLLISPDGLLVKKVAKFLEKATEVENSSMMAFDQSRLDI